MNRDGTQLPDRSYAQDRPVASFFVLAFALSYIVGIALVIVLQAVLPEHLADHADIPAKFGPTAAGLIMAGRVAGRDGVLRLLRAAVSLRVHPLWLLFAVGVPFGLVPLAIRLFAQTGGVVQWDNWNAATWSTALWLIPMKSLLGGGLGEELGWRGFAQPHLQRRMSALQATLLIWVVWTAWHLPAFAMAGDRTGEMPVWMFTLFVLEASILLTWMYNATGGNLLVPILFHGCANASESLFEALVPAASRVPALGWMTLLYGVLALGVLILQLRRFRSFDPFNERAWGPPSS